MSYLITASHGENWGKWEEEGMIKEQRAEHAVWLVKQGGTADKHAWTHETGHLDMEPFKHLTVQTHTHTHNRIHTDKHTALVHTRLLLLLQNETASKNIEPECCFF